MPAARRAEACTTKTLNLQCNSNWEAFLVRCVGAVQIALCKSCLNGQGLWCYGPNTTVMEPLTGGLTGRQGAVGTGQLALTDGP
jgi:hypothetical protein